MKITVDLRDVHFQEAVTKAVTEKIQELCAVAMEAKIEAALARLMEGEGKRMVRERIEEVFAGWNRQDFRTSILAVAREEIAKVALEEIRRLNPPTS